MFIIVISYIFFVFNVSDVCEPGLLSRLKEAEEGSQPVSQFELHSTPVPDTTTYIYIYRYTHLEDEDLCKVGEDS